MYIRRHQIDFNVFLGTRSCFRFEYWCIGTVSALSDNALILLQYETTTLFNFHNNR